MKINFEISGRVSDAASPPAAGSLSADELRLCFPARVTFVGDAGGIIKLDDVAVLGLMADLAELSSRLQSGASSAQLVDFYGEFELSFAVRAGALECSNTFGEGAFTSTLSNFQEALAHWWHQLRSEFTTAFSELSSNPAYEALCSFITRHVVGGDRPAR